MGSTAEPKPGDKGSDAAHPLAVQKHDLAALNDDQRQQIALRKNANIVTAQMSAQNWGKGLDEATRRAVADWGARNGIDPTTEIFVLGGSIYLNAQFYSNRLVGLLHRGLVLDYRQELIQHDPRLQAIVDEAIDPKLSDDLRAIAEEDRRDAFREIRRRRRLRIEHGAPEKSSIQGPMADHFAIGLTTIVLAAMPNTPIRGVKWAPHDAQDPVGKNYPQETALTRSARRALKQCVTHIPELARWVDGSAEDAVATVADALRSNQQRIETEKRTAIAASAGEPGTKSVGTADYLPAERPHREDVTEIRGPVAVQDPPVDGRHSSDAAWVRGETGNDAGRVSHEVAGDLDEARRETAASLEEQLGPLGSSQGAGADPGEEMNDLDLMDADERREYEERRRAGRK